MNYKLTLSLLAFVSTSIFSQNTKDVEITIYNQNVGLVKEKREIKLKKGEQIIKIQEIAKRIDPTSVHFKSISYPNDCFVLEQNFDYDLISQRKLLEKYIDKEIEIKEYLQENNTTKEKIKKGILLSIHDGIVVKFNDKIHINPQGSVILPELPEGLITRPTLSWLILNKEEGVHTIELSYLTEGINWLADYVLIVDKQDKKIDLTGWVTIDNQSGATYEDAKLKLIAGDINRVEEKPSLRRDVFLKAMPQAVPEQQFKEQEFFEYHIYTLQRKTTIKDNEKKQIEFVQTSDVEAKKLYIYDGARFSWYSPASIADDLYGDKCNKKIWVMIEFKNSKENNLGLPLPKGKIRVYKRDEEDVLQFIGEDRIDHTPKDETIRIYLGNAFDILGERKVLDRKSGDNWREIKIEVKIKNRKKEAIEIIVVEHHYTLNWKVLDSTHKYIKRNVDTIEFLLPVAKEKEETIVYSVKYWW